MNNTYYFVGILILTLGIMTTGIDNVYAHNAQVVGDFKVDIGWKKEPPIANEPNMLEVIFSIASDFDKQRFDVIPIQSSSPASIDDVMGLEKDLELEIRIGNGEKEFLTLSEEEDNPGTYFVKYTPLEEGLTKIHLYGKIKASDFEATFHPEKVEEGKMNNSASIPDWIKSNAKWWSEGTIGDSDFTSGIQYLIKNNILRVPITEQGASANKEIPSWIKSNAGWWADGMISDDDFIKGIQYMITNGIISV